MPSQPRIAYLVSQYPTANHTFVLREIVALRSQGFDIGVFAIRGADRSADQLSAVERNEAANSFVVLPPGWRFLTSNIATFFRHPLGYARGVSTALQRGGLRPARVLYHAAYFLEAVVAGAAVKKAGFRHVHTHFSSTVALIASRVFGFTLSMTIHGPDEIRDMAGFGMREKVAHSVFVVAISHYAKSQLMRVCNRSDWPKIEVCRLGVDPRIFAPRGAGATDGFRIICVGRLAPVKAHVILIAACAQLVAAGAKLTLHLVGIGSEKARLQNFIASLGMQKHVVFEGRKNQDELITLYGKSDAFALASFEEGVPVSLMEAMAMEIPCVATWVNGVPELMQSEHDGLTVAPSDKEGLASAIDRLMKDGQLRRRLGAAGRRKILQDYNLANNTAALAAIFCKRLGFAPEASPEAVKSSESPVTTRSPA